MSRKNTFFLYRRKRFPFVLVAGVALFFSLMIGIWVVKKNSMVTSIVPNTLLPIPTPPIPTPAPYPVHISGNYPADEISAAGVVIMDVDSHVYLYKKNADMLLSPASTTKLLTALVALDVYNPDDVVTIASVSAGGQEMGLVPGETITVENLLYGALIQSGNDAAWALAAHYSGGVDGFVALMNQKAKALHMDQSNFTNPMGFDGDSHKVTPLDLSLLSIAAIQQPLIAKMVAIPQITVSDVTHTYYHKLNNVNQLLGKIPGVGGIKTGWTEAAGENLITYVDRDGKKVIFVVLHSKDRFGDTMKLIDWVFENYRWESVTPSIGMPQPEHTP